MIQRPSRTSSAMPASLRTRMWWETRDCSIPKTDISSQTQSSRRRRRSMILSRFGSARALKILTMSFMGIG